MCRHRQQVQRWGQMLRSSERPQPRQSCVRNTAAAVPRSRNLSVYPPGPALPEGGRRAVPVLVPSLVSGTGCGMLRCRGCSTAAPGLELARKPEHVKVLLKRLRCSTLRTSSAKKSGRKPSQAFDAKYVNVKVQQISLTVKPVEVVEKPVRKTANRTEFIYFSVLFACLRQPVSIPCRRGGTAELGTGGSGVVTPSPGCSAPLENTIGEVEPPQETAEAPSAPGLKPSSAVLGGRVADKWEPRPSQTV